MRGYIVITGMAAACLLQGAEVAVVDEIIAKVNGEIITRNDYDRSRAQIEAQMRKDGLSGPRLAEELQKTEKNILRERIDQILLISRGKEMNINVDSDVNKQLADIQRNVKIADPEKFQSFVKDETGSTYEDYKNDLKNQLLTSRVVRQEVTGKIQFKKEELEKYYNDHKDEFQREERVFLRELLISTEGKDAAAVAQSEKKAKDLSARGKKGEKFDELAQANSDSATAPQGGDIGSYEKGKLRADIEKAVWDQPRGFVTDPINIGNGFLILKVEEHPKAGLASFDEAENDIRSKLYQPRMQPELRKFLTQLRVDAFLEIKPGYEDSGAAPGKNTAWLDPAEIKPETVTKEEVASRIRRKRLLGVVPIPGTTAQQTGTSSSNK
ncbi:MAG TPA: peptidylprolyl isomerase [Bryobacteraceae bacterium]|nr:peptidylprolyl isomerase [Bryobacteraceae bacterium]